MTDPTPHVLVDVDAIEHMLKTDSFPDDEEWADATGWLIAEIRRLRGAEAWRENVEHMAEQFDEIERLRGELGVLRAQRDAALEWCRSSPRCRLPARPQHRSRPPSGSILPLGYNRKATK
jgi:hypothetical protein